ncbi:MAG: hypothetical protein AB2A00_33780 [Myxococcota bacterium]
MVAAPTFPRLIALAALLAGTVAAVPGCSGTACSANDDCPLETVCRAGQCVGADEDPHGVLDAGLSRTDGGTQRGDAATAHGNDAGGQGDGGRPGGACPFDDDGVLTAEELPLALNVESRFVEARADGGIPVDLVGTTDSQGLRVWDFSAAAPGDQAFTLEALPLDDLWFGNRFPQGAYAVPLDGESTNYAIYQRTESVVQMLGVASQEPEHTLLTYDPPVDIVRFPVTLNQAFTSNTDVSGTFEGNTFYSSSDTYDLSVDARGHLVTPAGTFPVLRVRLQHQVDVPIAFWPFVLTYKYIRYSFMTPCYSQVAYVASLEGEEELQFSTAAELRRLGLAP